MIHFEPRDENSTDPDRTLYIEGTRILVGWILRGRPMTNLRSNWTEWQFTPATPPATPDVSVTFPVHKGISGAYEDARRYAATLPAATLPAE